jgi:adenosylcobinamide kinase/adenosylcobinamide-phosphate guanylyltransferase
LKAKVVLITGGVRSGKSAYALKLGEASDGERAFLATCQPLDEEMRERIEHHRKTRRDHWETFEEPIDICKRIHKLARYYDVILIDCLTLWLSNLIDAFGQGSDVIERELRALETLCGNIKGTLIIVSNELGLGIVPANPLARHFRDLAGSANQRLAAAADEFYFMISGIPLRVK